MAVAQVKPKEQVFYVVLIGIAGLIFGVILFATGRYKYGDVILDNKKPLVDSLLDNRIIALDSSINYWKTQKDIVIKANPKPAQPATFVLPDSAKDFLKKIAVAEAVIRNTRNERLLLSAGNTDTSLAYFSHYISINRLLYAKALNDSNWTKGVKYIPLKMVDTCKSVRDYPLSMNANLKLRINLRYSRIDFFSDYPQFGLWIIFSLAQVVLWAMIFPVLLGDIFMLTKTQSIDNPFDKMRLLRYSLISWLFVGVFLIVIYVWLIDQQIVADDYFLTDYTFKITIFGIIGYSVASFCFGIYVTMARELDELTKNIKDSQQDNSIQDNNILVNRYMALKSLFDNSFYCSALILSLCVLWTGILINALNGTQGFRFYFFLSGKNFIPNDFPYLIGLLNTMLLLIFYIPVKLKFGSIPAVVSSTVVGGQPVQQPSATPGSVFGTLSGALGTLLVTASPLLASLVTSLFKLLVGN